MLLINHWGDFLYSINLEDNGYTVIYFCPVYYEITGTLSYVKTRHDGKTLVVYNSEN